MLRLTIRTQLLLAFAVPIALLGLSTALTLGQVRAMNDSSDRMAALATTRAMTRDVMLAIVTYRLDARGYALYHDARNHGKALASAQNVAATIAAVRGRLDVEKAADLHEQFVAADAAAARVLGSTGALFRYATNHRDDVLAAYGGRADTPSRRGARSLVLGAAHDVDSSNAPLQALIASVNTREEAAAHAVDTAEATAWRSVTACAVATILLSLLICLVVSARIRNRLAAVSGALRAIVDEDFASLTTVMECLAAGDLTARAESARAALHVRGGDEIADLTASYNALAERLTQIAELTNDSLARLSTAVTNVAETATAVALASTQVSGASSQATVAVTQIATSVAQVAHGSSDQAERIGSAGRAFEELARVAEQIAQGAADQSVAVTQAHQTVRALQAEIAGLADHGNNLASSASQADTQAANGTEAVSETASAMRTMHERTVSSERAMASLEQRSNAVEKIIATIEEIADQTNLLALNAAIEAARAGEHGRGFAVVADEVRKLAERAATATSEIAVIVAAIRHETSGAADAMRASTHAVGGALDLATRANDALEGVAGVISTTSRVAGELALRAVAMTDASTGLARNMDSVSAVVEENAAAAGQMRHTAEQIAQTVAPIAITAEEQSRAAGDASSATNELAAGIEEMSATASALLEHAEGLRSVVSAFRVA